MTESSFAFALCLTLGLGGCREHPTASPPTSAAPRVDAAPDYLAFEPEWVKQQPPGYRTALIFALSPGADASGMLDRWRDVGEKHHWIVAASKTFRNGVSFDLQLPQLEAQVREIERRYPVDPAKVIATGLSGGAMGAHALAGFHPELVRAVVANTGMMEATFKVASYPEGKLAAFLASPTDFRYGEMKSDRAFLESHRWTTTWIEFPGGHTLAPLAVEEEVAAWLSDRL